MISYLYLTFNIRSDRLILRFICLVDYTFDWHLRLEESFIAKCRE